MFGGNKASFEDMSAPPDLREDEDRRFAIGSRIETSSPNAIIAGTNQRLFVKRKRGKEVPEEHQKKVGLEIELGDIDIVRRVGTLQKEIELVCGESVHKLPPIQNYSDKVVDAVVEQEGFEERETGSGEWENVINKVFSAMFGMPLLLN